VTASRTGSTGEGRGRKSLQDWAISFASSVQVSGKVQRKAGAAGLVRSRAVQREPPPRSVMTASVLNSFCCLVPSPFRSTQMSFTMVGPSTP